MRFTVTNTYILYLIPFAVMPWISSFYKMNNYSNLSLIPSNAISLIINILVQTLGSIAIIAIILGIAELSITGQLISKVGNGAQIVLLFDRSRSMDMTFAGQSQHGNDESKARAAQRIITHFVEQDKQNQFAVVMFSTSPMYVLPMTDKREAIEAAIRAITRPGLAFTNVGSGLLMSLSFFTQQEVIGSRVILLVSDGAAVIDTNTQMKIQQLFMRHKVTLYWVYLRTKGNPSLFEKDQDDKRQASINPEQSLHQFFNQFVTPYHVYEADDSDDLQLAINDISSLESHPIYYNEVLQQKSQIAYCYSVALLSLLTLLFVKHYEIKQLC